MIGNHTKKYLHWLALFVLLPATTGFAAKPDFSVKPASPSTIEAQKAMLKSLPEDDGRDLEFATRGFIATVEKPKIYTADGRQIWDVDKFAWVTGEAPATVNPSLWRHVQILAKHGLFKVADGVWQVRGLDASNMTVVSGKSGWIIIDPLYTVETARVALELVNKHLGKRPVTAVIYTHSHGDHFGGVRGVIGEGKAPSIISPALLVEETISEFLLNGNSAGRRAAYQFGTDLEPGPKGVVSGGIVIDAAIGGYLSLLPPDIYINKTGETLDVDGVTIEFQMVPETEAPSEMNLFLPEQRTLFVSEMVSCTMHNLQTPRGAKVRDALRWVDYLTEAIELYGDRTDALITGHCWPRFGNEEVIKHLSLQRDNYKFIHDQTVRMLNGGKTPTEIAEQIKPPATIANEWSNRSYYGSLKHNAKAVYQYYIGWWDGNPAHLDMLPPEEQGERYVEAIGGSKNVIKVAEKAMAQGDYRWAAELLNHLVFAEPGNDLARAKLADSYEQLGYQAESAIWRNYYLSGAAELRGHKPFEFKQDSPDMLEVTDPASLLNLIATRIAPDKIAESNITIAFNFTDSGQHVLSTLSNAVLVNQPGKSIENPDIKITASKKQLMGLFIGKVPLQALQEKGLEVTGNMEKLELLLSAMDIPPADYGVVLP